MQWYFVAALLTVLTSSQGILTTLSQSNGGYKYNYATVPFLAEVFKAVPTKEALQPSVDGNCTPGCRDNHKPDQRLWTNFMRLSLLSTNPGVYAWNPLRLPISISRFGAIFNMGRLVLDDFRGGFEKGPWWQRLLNGYDLITWMVVLNLGSTGLLVSWLMKYADNIVKVYSTSMAMLLTMVLSVYLFSFKPTLQLFLGIVICMMSLHMYFAPPNMLVDLPSTSKASPESLKEISIDRKNES
ncbi:hypothetical protein CDL15_Pgr028040 [Punica granatum]|uniref:PRA1 family protein n=1 Tax=Punica granatum TaxID=22663 RepID=A0A218XJU8_PUNGR|nr:hypothetical protein CDL15_Pgr028040 [Punica granatum]